MAIGKIKGDVQRSVGVYLFREMKYYIRVEYASIGRSVYEIENRWKERVAKKDAGSFREFMQTRLHTALHEWTATEPRARKRRMEARGKPGFN